MSDPSVSSIDPANISDFWSQTEIEGDDPASSPYAPKHARLVPGGPPRELSSSSIGDMPGFLFGAKRANADAVEDDDIALLEASLRRLKQRQRAELTWGNVALQTLPRGRPGSARDLSDAPPQPTTTSGRQAGIRAAFPILIAVLIAGAIASSAAYLGATNGQTRHGTAANVGAVARHATILAAARAPQTRPAEYQTAAIGGWIPPADEISTGQATAPARPAALLPVAANEETVMLASRSEAQSLPAAPPPRRLDRAYVELLANQGRQLIAAGDLAAARVVLERAAEAGDPDAALTLGGTYDPLILKQSGALGITGDPDKARTWYEKARNFGSLEAASRLDLLAAR